MKAETPPGGKTNVETTNYQEYINTYYARAIQLQKKYKIPASIILAQALLESKAGQSFLALAGNNHFGLKCTDWQGLCIYKDDEGKNDCFRKYLNVSESFEDHSRFLSERIYYKPLFNLKITDYKAWATGLKQCGYATDSQYATKLVQIIEKYKLYYYDTAKE
jgi:flagellum-specific peptidoglycan hydrolase FlgJ